MSEWWTYRLSSFLLFSRQTYERLHELYNAGIWPMQIAMLLLGIAIAALVFRRAPSGARIAALLLAACWLWVAWAFHLRRYATINWAAVYFAGAFIAEALLLAWIGVARGRVVIQSMKPQLHCVGWWMLPFALIAQPAIGLLAGRTAMQVGYFGTAPDPTVVGTLGVLLLARDAQWTLMAIPLLWCALSGAFQWAMHAPDALVMPVIGLVAVLAAAARARTARRSSAT